MSWGDTSPPESRIADPRERVPMPAATRPAASLRAAAQAAESFAFLPLAACAAFAPALPQDAPRLLTDLARLLAGGLPARAPGPQRQRAQEQRAHRVGK